MEPNHIRAELIRRGITVAEVGRMCDASRQLVWRAIRRPTKRGKSALIRRKIAAIIGEAI